MPRLVISRKGFDSANGGRASPLLPDGRLLSLPIPDPGSPITYAQALHDDGTLLDLLRRLGIDRVRHRREWLDVGPALGAHLDPDLDVGQRPRRPGWRPSLGQVGSPQAHLASQGVGPGDLFLFFGRFQQTQARGASLRYVGPQFHALWGWLEVGDVVPATDAPAWADDHPHVRAGHLARYSPGRNTLYIAARRSTWAPGLPGAGTFTFGPACVLTTPGRTVSHWTVPAVLHPDRAGATLSHHAGPARWTVEADGVHLRTVAIGQEFVIAADPPIRSWCREFLQGRAGAASWDRTASGRPVSPR